jgi:hypothetical protein
MFTERPFAPKPVKRYSNNLGLKLNSKLDRNIKVDYKYSLSEKGKTLNNFDNPFSPEISQKKTGKIFIEEDEFSIFKSELEMNQSEEYAKCEIFSILKRNDSTFYASLNGKSECSENDENRLPSNLGDEENFKFTLPPIRTSNPYYKNVFGSSSDEEEEGVDLNFNKFKSKIFCRGKMIEN